MTAQVVRPVAICVFRHEGKILVARGHDPHRNGAYLRPLGGGIITKIGRASCRERV